MGGMSMFQYWIIGKSTRDPRTRISKKVKRLRVGGKIPDQWESSIGWSTFRGWFDNSIELKWTYSFSYCFQRWNTCMHQRGKSNMECGEKFQFGSTGARNRVVCGFSNTSKYRESFPFVRRGPHIRWPISRCAQVPPAILKYQRGKKSWQIESTVHFVRSPFTKGPIKYFESSMHQEV